MGDIADEHVARMMWDYGDPHVMENEPYADTPEFGGWRKYLLRHSEDTPEQWEIAMLTLERNGTPLRFTFPCQYCGTALTFINGKPFDFRGQHRCLERAQPNRLAMG